MVMPETGEDQLHALQGLHSPAETQRLETAGGDNMASPGGLAGTDACKIKNSRMVGKVSSSGSSKVHLVVAGCIDVALEGPLLCGHRSPPVEPE